MLELAQQLSYYLSVVDGGATSKLVGLGQQLASISMVGTAARAAIQSVVQPLQAMGAAWSQREQQLNNVARSLRQYQYVGQSVAEINAEIARTMPGASAEQRSARFTEVYNQQFQAARTAARGIFGEMTQLAAVLPGETNDYMMSFSQALPHLSRVRGMTDQRAMRLSSYLSAGAISAGIDSGQAARDLVQALTVGTHITDRSWMEVWSQYARDPRTGRRISTTSDFNRLTMDQKVRVLEDIAAQLQPQMDAVGDSFEALMGTFNSARHEMYLAATEPLFDAWTRVIGAANGVMGALMVPMSALGQVLARMVTPYFDALAGRLRNFTEQLNHGDKFMRMAHAVDAVVLRVTAFGHSLHGLISHLTSGGGNALGFIRSTFGRRFQEQIGGGGGWLSVLSNAAPMILLRILGVSLGPIGWVLTSVLTRMFMGGDRSSLTAGFGALLQIIAPLVNLGMTLYGVWDALVTATAAVLSILLPPLLMLAGIVLGSVIGIFTELVNLVLNLVIPVLGGAFIIVGFALAAFAAIIEVSMIGWRALISVLGLVSMEGGSMIDMLRNVTRQFQQTIRDFRAALYSFLEDLGIMSAQERAAAYERLNASNTQVASQWLQDLQRTIQDMQNQSNSARTGRAPPQRPQVHQDFRYSRFDITQQFAEGFDPDRIAAVFAGDLEALSEQRLQSGLLPAFTGP